MTAEFDEIPMIGSDLFGTAEDAVGSDWDIVHTLIVLPFDDDGLHFDVKHSPLCPSIMENLHVPPTADKRGFPNFRDQGAVPVLPGRPVG